ncbi:uncharacterized protein BJX67DRAFT_190887 [Aspergillus lucknowensis]|uniref:Uncharacterized protein n=1 Tax=Aspergillus lucknowensis TaxID=176173 RepID=A0ABR4LKJ8_9EURO
MRARSNLSNHGSLRRCPASRVGALELQSAPPTMRSTAACPHVFDASAGSTRESARRTFTTASCPLYAARWSGGQPSACRTDGSAPRAINSCTIPRSPRLAAAPSGVQPPLSAFSMSIPRPSSKVTSLLVPHSTAFRRGILTLVVDCLDVRPWASRRADAQYPRARAATRESAVPRGVQDARSDRRARPRARSERSPCSLPPPRQRAVFDGIGRCTCSR